MAMREGESVSIGIFREKNVEGATSRHKVSFHGEAAQEITCRALQAARMKSAGGMCDACGEALVPMSRSHPCGHVLEARAWFRRLGGGTDFIVNNILTFSCEESRWIIL